MLIPRDIKHPFLLYNLKHIYTGCGNGLCREIWSSADVFVSHAADLFIREHLRLSPCMIQFRQTCQPDMCIAVRLGLHINGTWKLAINQKWSAQRTKNSRFHFLLGLVREGISNKLEFVTSSDMMANLGPQLRLGKCQQHEVS